MNRLIKLSEMVKPPINEKKSKLIENNLKTECNLFKSCFDYKKAKVLEKFLNKEKNNENKKPLPYNDEVDKYLKNNNPITKSSVPSIGNEGYINKYLPSQKEYQEILDNQIKIKEERKKKERQIDKDKERNLYQNELKNDENILRSRKLKQNQIKSDFLQENQKLIELKQQQRHLDKSADIAIENKRIKYLEEEEKNQILILQNKKFRIKKELLGQLNQQLVIKKKNDNQQLKDNKDNEQRNLNLDDNVYREKKNNRQYGKCIKCSKIMRKNLICPTVEFEMVKDAKDENQAQLDKICSKV